MQDLSPLRLAEEIGLARRMGPGDPNLPRGEVLLSGKPTARLVDGSILEAAVAWQPAAGTVRTSGRRYLLLSSDGVDFEDFLNLTLLGPSLELLDRARLGVIYGSGALEGLSLLPPNRVHFRWGGCLHWEVELLLRPHLGLPWFGEVRGLTRPRSLRRWFRVRSLPKPPSGSSPAEV